MPDARGLRVLQVVWQFHIALINVLRIESLDPASYSVGLLQQVDALALGDGLALFLGVDDGLQGLDQ